jgi:CRISPR system Cascade subunit CasB
LTPADDPLADCPPELARMLAAHAAPDDRPPAVRLNVWLNALVHGHDYAVLADLRRPAAPPGRGQRPPRRYALLKAADFAAEEEHREVYQRVAFLFARYHAGASRPRAAHGSTGAALRRVGGPAGRGPKDPGAKRLLDRLCASHRIPWRHLQHAVERMRSGDTTPPSWAGLADDLVRWESRGDDVPDAWARDFYTPAFLRTNGTPA